MKKISLTVALLISSSGAHAWPWSDDMANQISTKPQASVNSAAPGMQPFPKRSVPIPGTAPQVKDMDQAQKLANPIAADAKSVESGGKLFKIYCATCHGDSGKGRWVGRGQAAVKAL